MARKDEIITRIKAQALRLFIQNGLQASTMEGIAKAAQTTKKTLYKYYPSKKDIFNDIVNNLLDQFEAYSTFQYSKSEPIKDQLSKIVDRKIELMTNPNYIKASKLLSIELIKSNPIDKMHYQKFYNAESRFINWIKEAQKDGKIQTQQSADIIAKQILALIKEQVYHPVLFSMEKITKKDINICKETVMAFIEYLIIKS